MQINHALQDDLAQKQNRIPGDRLKQANQRVLPLVYVSPNSINQTINRTLFTPSNQEHTVWYTVLSALQVVISRYCHSECVAIATKVTSETLILAQLPPKLSFSELVEQNRAQCQSGKNKNLHSWLSNAHCGVGLDMRVTNEKACEYNNDDFTLQSHGLDIKLTLNGKPNSLTLTWTFNSNKYSPLFIQHLESALVHCMQYVSKQPNTPLCNISIADDSGMAYIPTRDLAQEPSSSQPKLKHIVALFEAQVASTPNAIALLTMENLPLQSVSRTEQARTTLTYTELNQQVNRVARLLQKKGVKAGARVGVLLSYSPEVLVSVLAIFKLNAQYVPFDPDYPSERLNYMLEDANVDWMLTHSRHAALLALSSEKQTELNILQWDSEAFQKQLSEIASDNINTELKDDVAYVVYTSGTTGQPKGVLGTHTSLSNRLIWLQRDYPAKPGTLFGTSTHICFVDHIAELLQPMICGSTVCMLPEERNSHASGDGASSSTQQALLTQIDCIQEYGIERLTLLPSLLITLLTHAPKGALASLKLVITSGEPLFQNVVDAFHSRLNGKAKLLNLYGTTECGADVSFYEAPFPEHLRVMKYFDAEQASKGDLPAHISVDEDYFTAPNVPVESLMHQFMDVNIPSEPEEYNHYVEQIKTELFPYLIDVSSQKFIGHMTSALPSFMSEFSRFITHANQNIVKIETSKVLTFMERQLMAMLHKMFFEQSEQYYQERVQNPRHMFGVVTSGGSLANVMALYSARNKALMRQGIQKAQLQKQGAIACMQSLGYSRAVVLVSRLAHYSIRKTVGLLGLGEDNLIIIEQDEHQRIDPEKLANTIEACHRDNLFIIALIGIAGATETGTVDPLPQLAQIAQNNDIHFHVDAAWGGAFMFSDEYKYKLAGIEHADTITFCAHKQLYLAQGISLCLFKDSQGLYSVTTHAEYQAEAGSFDLGQFTLEGSRPATSLMLHAALHLFSRSGYNWLMQQSMLKAAFLKALIQTSDSFELVGENDLNIINYRYIPRSLRNKSGDYTALEHEAISQATEAVQEQQFIQGRTFVSKTRIIHPQFSEGKISVFRVVPINPRTTFDDLIDVLNDQLLLATEQVEKGEGVQQIELTHSMLHALAPIRPSVPIGKPIANTELYIMDEHHNLLPPGAIGEIYVTGVGIAQGYLNQPELTQQSFIQNPFNPAQRLYRTFDLGRVRHDGQIEYCGRDDHQVKLHGNRIELDEIEMKLKAINDVAVAKVAFLQVSDHGEFLAQNAVIAAYIEPSERLSQRDKLAFQNKLNTALKRQLPDDHVPEQLVIFDKIPTLPNNKIDLNQCEQIAKEIVRKTQ